MDAQTNDDRVALPNYAIESGDAPVVETATWLGEGDFCRCYLVNTAYVFRFAKHAQASEAMQVEACVLPFLADSLGVEVPKPLFTGRQDDTGQSLFGYRLLEGQPLDSDSLESLPPASQTILISQMADFARQLHAFPIKLMSDCKLPTLDPFQHFASVMEQAQATIRPRLTDDAWHYHQDLMNTYTHHRTFFSYQPSLLHGDLSPDHFLADTEQPRLTGVIDFGDMCIGDPAWDGIYIYEDYGLDVLRSFLHQYDAASAHMLEQKVRIYQQLNNVAYCLSALRSGEEAEIAEALAALEEQATAQHAS